ncbi:MAG TPA: WYL domain-containing protein [Candidatus Binatia bacterium]|nr:WYL domain-containing protein [Candidatus Binatia bacterium]
MRGDRLLSILLQLQAGGRLTAKELADRLEVSERTIHRDVEALSGAGVPVYAERGRGGGIALLDDYRTDLTGLTSDEARALFSFGGPQVAGQLGLGSDLEAALRKLLAALPTAQRMGAQRARERLLVDASPWLRSADGTNLAPLQDAVWGDRRLRIRYRRGEGTPVERMIDPLGLVAKAGTWYVLAETEGQTRVYRVSRIEEVSETGETFTRPPGFDLAGAWAAAQADFEARAPGYPTIVRVAPDHVGLVLRVAGGRLQEPATRLPAGRDGWPRFELLFPAMGAARAVLLSCGPAVEVLAPKELRVELAAMARAVLLLYDRC